MAKIKIIFIIFLLIVFITGCHKEIEYKCPDKSELVAGEWIDCEPPAVGDFEPNSPCIDPYRRWIEENCPDIKFAD